MSKVIFADDSVLVAETVMKLVRFEDECGWVYTKRKLKVNIGYSKVMQSV